MRVKEELALVKVGDVKSEKIHDNGGMRKTGYKNGEEAKGDTTSGGAASGSARPALAGPVGQ